MSYLIGLPVAMLEDNVLETRIKDPALIKNHY
jgi:hypothetical protein